MHRAERFALEIDENGYTLQAHTEEGVRFGFRVLDPEQLYDQVKAAILPWLRERDEAFAEFKQGVQSGTGPAAPWLRERAEEPENLAALDAFACEIDESGGYDLSDPKHPDWHSVHADIWDAREGK